LALLICGVHVLPSLAILSFCALPYILFSVYYQWQVAKQWCVLCLTVQTILFAEGIANFTLSGFSNLSLYASLMGQLLLSFTIPKNENEVNLTQNEMNEIWFAFYQKPTPVKSPVTKSQVWIYLSPGVLVDGSGWGIGPDGNPHPIGPLGPLVAELFTTAGILSMSKYEQQRAESCY